MFQDIYFPVDIFVHIKTTVHITGALSSLQIGESLKIVNLRLLVAENFCEIKLSKFEIFSIIGSTLFH